MVIPNNTPEILKRHLESLFGAPENLPGSGISRIQRIGVSAVWWASGEDQKVMLVKPDGAMRILQAIKDDGEVISTKDFAFNEATGLLYVAEQFDDSRDIHSETPQDLTKIGESFALQQELGMTRPTRQDEREFWGHLGSGLKRIGVSTVFFDEN